MPAYYLTVPLGRFVQLVFLIPIKSRRKLPFYTARVLGAGKLVVIAFWGVGQVLGGFLIITLSRLQTMDHSQLLNSLYKLF